MPHLIPISARKIISVLERENFVCIRTKGGHHFFKHKFDNRTTVVIFHRKDIGVGLLRKILKDVEWSVEEFLLKI